MLAAVMNGLPIGIDIYILLMLCMKWITKENPLDNIGKFTQCSEMANGKEIQEKGDMYICMVD